MDRFAVTIAREHGSGGRLIGRKLAEDLGVDLHDKEIIALASEESRFHEDFIQTMEQKKASGFFYDIFIDSGIGIQASARVLKDYVLEFLKREQAGCAI